MAGKNQAKAARLEAQARRLAARAARNGRLSTGVKAAGKQIKADRKRWG